MKKAPNELVRSFSQRVQDGEWYFTFRTASYHGTVLRLAAMEEYKIHYYHANLVGFVHSRTCKNIATACNTLSRLGIQSVEDLIAQ